jgi:hypothetical protein
LSEIIRALADENSPRLPLQAVTIEPGERLCISGMRWVNGELVELRVVPWAVSSNWVSLELDSTKEETRLRVRHSSERPMRYRAAPVVSALRLAVPTSTAPVEPNQTGEEVWPYRAPLVLFGFRFVPPMRAMMKEPGSETTPKPFRGHDGTGSMFGFTTSLGIAEVDMPDLERVLLSQGYSSLPVSMPYLILGVEGVFGPVRTGLLLESSWLSSRDTVTPEALGLNAIGAGLLLGYDFLRLPGSATFVAAQIVGKYIEADWRGLRAEFGVQLDSVSDDARLEARTRRLSLELGHERYFVLGPAFPAEHVAILLGGRLGYNWQLGGTDWATPDECNKSRDLRGGPDFDFSGLSFRLVFGIVVD